VVIEEVVVAEQSMPATPHKTGQVTSSAAQNFVKNRTKLGAELIGATLSCGLTVYSGIGVVGSIGTAVPTGGVSLLLFVASWTGFTTGAIQCGNGLVRVGAALADLDGGTLDAWDKNKKYAVAILLVDALGVASAVGSLPFAVRKLWEVFCRLRAYNAARLSFDALRRLTRPERLRAVAKILDEATRSGDAVTEIVQAAKQAQVAARTIPRSSSSFVSHTDTLQRIVSEQTVRQLHASLSEVLANITGLGLSATPAEMTGSGSGSLNWVINLLDAGQPKI